MLLFGSIGEFYAIDVKTKAEAVRFAVSKVAGRMKVLVGVGDTNLDNVRTLAAESEAAGADALVAVSPYYFGPSPDCAKRYFSAVAKATTLPVILYNFPARTGNDLTPELVADLAAENQNIIGIKDTVDTISHTRKVIAAVQRAVRIRRVLHRQPNQRRQWRAVRIDQCGAGDIRQPASCMAVR